MVHELSTCDQSHDTMHARFCHTTPQLRSVTRHPNCDQSHDTPTAISHTTPDCDQSHDIPTAISHTTYQLRSVTRNHARNVLSHDIPTAISHTTSQLQSVTRHPTAISHTTPCTQCSVTRHPQLRSVTQHLRYFKLIILMSFN